MRYNFLFAVVFFMGLLGVFAQEQDSTAVDATANAAAQANNPLANMTALNFHNYFMPSFKEAPDDMYMNTTWARFAKPFDDGKWLLRVSAPVTVMGTPEVGGGTQTTAGLGDVNAFMSYNFISKPTITAGVGPMLVAPTATDELLGAGKWQIGFASVIFVAKSPKFQFGGLITWQASIAGQSNRESTSIAALQPFGMYQLGKGNYLRSSSIWVFDLLDGHYQMPLGFGYGKILKSGNTVFNLFIEPQYTVLSYGVQPEFQLFAGVNLQFMN